VGRDGGKGGGAVRRYVCRSRDYDGPAGCPGSAAPRAEVVESRVLEALRAQLLHPDAVAAALKASREAAARQDATRDGDRARLERELAEAGRSAERLLDQVQAGMPWRLVEARHGQLERRRAELQAALQAAPAAEVVRLHPGFAEAYRKLLDRLQPALDGDASAATAEARDALRRIVRAVWVIKQPGHGAYCLEVEVEAGVLLHSCTNGTGASRPVPLSQISLPVRLTA
jgi:site-specific DNA recombinase